MKVEVELHNVDTEVEVYDNLRGGGDLGDEADVENPPDENVFYSDKKHAEIRASPRHFLCMVIILDF